MEGKEGLSLWTERVRKDNGILYRDQAYSLRVFLGPINPIRLGLIIRCSFSKKGKKTIDAIQSCSQVLLCERITCLESIMQLVCII